MEAFKFRAECEHDVKELQQLVSFDIESISVVPISVFPDVEVTLTMDSIYLEQLRDYMRLIDDSHVMIQTLATEPEYTGKRNYDI
jgi:inosine/xanthosine triphosphate pyrophosphatase family protein